MYMQYACPLQMFLSFSSSQYKANCVERSVEESISPTSSPVVPSKSWKWSPGALTPIGGGHYFKQLVETESPVGSPSTILTSFGGEGE